MNWSYEQLERSLNMLIAEMAVLSSNEIAEIGQFVNAGEYGVAFETLCALLKEEGKTIPEHCKVHFVALAEKMNIDPSWWEQLSKTGLTN